MALAPIIKDGRRSCLRYGNVRNHLFAFFDYPEITADNNSSERELRPTATYRNVTGDFRPKSGTDLYAADRSITGTAQRRRNGAYQAITAALRAQTPLAPG